VKIDEDDTEVFSPMELQIGFMIQQYGLEILDDKSDFGLITRAGKLCEIHRVFTKEMQKDGQKNLSRSEWELIKREMGIG
jgi:hypothetical protein